MRKQTILLVIIVCFGFFLRVYRLSSIPAGLNPDEASLGYTAYSLLTNGIDEHGVFLPITIQSFGDWKLPVYPYLDILFVWLFGLNVLAVRLPSAVAGTIGIFLIYLIAQRIFKNNSISLFVSLFYAISPWNVFFSHAAYEVNLATSIFLGGFYYFLKFIDEKKKVLLIVSTALFCLTIFTYHAYILFIPLWIFCLVVLYKKYIVKKSNVFSLIILIFLFSLAYFTVIKGSFFKASSVGIFNDQNILYNRAEALRGDKAGNPKIERFLYTKISGVSYQLFQNYLATFSPSFLFDKGGEKIFHTTGYFGYLFPVEAFIIPFGILTLFWRREKTIIILSLWLFLGMLPSSITLDAPNAARLFIIMPLFTLISGYGLYSLITIIKKTIFSKILLPLVFLILSTNVIYFLDIYFVHFNYQRVRYWYYAQNAAAKFAQKYPQYNIVMRGPENFPYIYFLFYGHYDSKKFASEAVYYKPTPEGFYHVKSFGRYEFLDKIDYNNTKKNTIYLDDTRLDDLKHSIFLPSGQPIVGYLIQK